MTKTQQKIEQIHREFNTASETLLKEAKLIIANRQASAEKAERLKAAGFSQANEVVANKDFFLTKETVEYIEYYQQKYPFNKFITRDQVLAINKKYNLVAAPVDRYKGFVPDKNLRQIEAFKVDEKDIAENLIQIKKFTYNYDSQKERQERLRKMYPDLLLPKSEVWFATTTVYAMAGDRTITDNWVDLSSYEEIDNRNKIICAPLKDMDIDGLKKKDSIFSMFKTVHVPDPVVLQPVKGGYLIITAWGDEASDEIVVNSINN